jgi:hypothetical protein
MWAPWEPDIPTEHDQSLDAPVFVQIPPLPKLSWEEADNLVEQASAHVVMSYLVASAPYRFPEVAADLTAAAEPGEPSQGAVPEEDTQKMLQATFLLPERENLGRTTVVNFAKELKPAGWRRRVITWPRHQNEVERHIAKLLPYKRLFFHPGEIREHGRFKFVALADFKKYYQQFLFPMRRYWPIKIAGKSFTLRTIPTGSTFSPILAQALIYAIAEASVKVARGVEFDAMIDNVRFVSNDLGELKRVWTEFLRVCERMRVTLGEVTTPASVAYDHLGMHVSRQRHVSLTFKVARKLIKSADEVTTPGVATWRSIQSAFGRLLYALTTVGIPLDKAYFVLKFMRRRSRTNLEPDDVTTVWTRARIDWRNLVLEALNSHYMFTTVPQRECALYTDASEEGWGVVVFGLYASCTVFGDRWTPRELGNRIDRLEFQALKIGLRWIAKEKGQGRIAVRAYVDNTTTLFVMQKGFSAKYTLNEAAAACREICEEHAITLLGPEWVPTSYNVADHPSRTFDRKDAEAAVRRQVQGN